MITIIILALLITGCATFIDRPMGIEKRNGVKVTITERTPTRWGKILGKKTHLAYEEIVEESAFAATIRVLRSLGKWFLALGLAAIIGCVFVYVAFANPVIQGLLVAGMSAGALSFFLGLVCMLCANVWVLSVILIGFFASIGLLIHFLVKTRKMSVVNGAKGLRERFMKRAQ
jgi:hypothetical protein